MPDTISIDKLRTDVQGRVIGPDDPWYDDARTVFYGGIDRRPAVIVRVANDADVARVIALARETGLELAVRSGGHSIPGHSVSEGGIVLDLADMRSIDIDPGERTAWAETGLTALEFSKAAHEHDLALGFGDTGSVGIGGITLGGGVGYLSRRYGLTIDHLVAADLVTADGEVRRVDAQAEPDLFWAIRGGGGNFGVATRFLYTLDELPTVVGGMLLLPATPDTITRFIAEAGSASEELSTIANVMKAPPMPFIPAEAHGKPSIMALMCFAGDADAGAQALAPFRGLAEPMADMVRPIPYPEIYPPEEEGYHPTATAINMFVDAIGAREAETILDQIERSTAMMGVAQLRVLGGAISRVPNDATAYAHRDRGIMVNVAALYEGADQAAEHAPWVDGFAQALNQGYDGAYANFLADEGSERIRAAYPGGTWDRLRAIKARFDPTNLFRLNQNIPPTAEERA